jgi:hypothetical protein
MIRIEFLEPADLSWTRWRSKCAGAQQTLNKKMALWLRQTGQGGTRGSSAQAPTSRPKISAKLYKAQKERVYLKLDGAFRGKCAYCETRIFTNQHGDVEHFRPKGRVTDKSGLPVVITIGSRQVGHPGYYWLAYDWQNLLPSCQLCNQPSAQRSGGRPIGKRDYFPLRSSHRATRPGDERFEQPLLINPVLEDPDQHLLLDETGVLAAKTPAGQECIDVFGLNERSLPNERATTFKNTQRTIRELLDELSKDPNGGRTKALLSQLSALNDGAEPYTMAARLAIRATLTPVFGVVSQFIGP